MAVWFNSEWPWYVAGPLIGLFVPALLIVGNKVFGISSSLSHLCSAIAPGKIEYFRYDWRRAGLWNLVFVAGVLLGGFLASHIGPQHTIAISEQTKITLSHWGIHDLSGETISVPLKTLGSGIRYFAGGTIFGLGWALTGACPGPLVALIGAGVTVMSVGLISALLGTWVYGWVRPRLPH